jgi:hypothetical protein
MRKRATMQWGRNIHRENQLNSMRIFRGLLLTAAIMIVPTFGLEPISAQSPGRARATKCEAFASANELYDFKLPQFQQWLRENRLLRQPSEGDTDFARRVYLTHQPKLRDESSRRMCQAARVSRPA